MAGVTKAAAARAEIVDSLKAACLDLKVGAEISKILDQSPIWAQYKYVNFVVEREMHPEILQRSTPRLVLACVENTGDNCWWRIEYSWISYGRNVCVGFC